MKKNLLLLLLIMVSAVSSAQFTVWEDDFDDADASDWILLDKDGNGSNWITRKNIKLDENNVIVDGTASILGTYNIDLATASPLSSLNREVRSSGGSKLINWPSLSPGSFFMIFSCVGKSRILKTLTALLTERVSMNFTAC